MDPFVETVLEFARSETYESILQRILAYEDKVLSEGGWHKGNAFTGRPLGWEWHEVNVAPGHLMPLVHAGIIGVIYKSNKHTVYRLTDPELTRKVLAGEVPPETASPEDRLDEERAWIAAYGDVFGPIVGYDDVKDLLLKAIEAPRPVHVLLEGPPASAKTLFLMEIARFPRAYFALGGTASKAGLTDMLLLYRPRYLLLDEIDTIDNARDYAALLHLMENGEVIETKYRRQNRVSLWTWVFGAGNDVSRLPPALLSRFGGPRSVIRFKEHTSAEFLDIATSVLVKREGVAGDFAREIATAALDLGSKDVRLAVRLARLARDQKDLAEVVETMRRRR